MPENFRTTAREIDHCRLNAEFTRTAVQNQIELAGGFFAQVFTYMLSCRRADAAERVGRRRRETAVLRTAVGCKQRVRPGVRRASQRHSVLTSGYPAAAARLLFKHHRERPRPVTVGKLLGFRRDFGPPGNVVGAGHMDDQRMVERTPLGTIGGGHGRLLIRISSQAVDGFGGHGDEPAGFQNRCGPSNSSHIDRLYRRS